MNLLQRDIFFFQFLKAYYFLPFEIDAPVVQYSPFWNNITTILSTCNCDDYRTVSHSLRCIVFGFNLFTLTNVRFYPVIAYCFYE